MKELIKLFCENSWRYFAVNYFTKIFSQTGPATLFKKQLRYRCFHVNSAKLFKIANFTEQLRMAASLFLH